MASCLGHGGNNDADNRLLTGRTRLFAQSYKLSAQQQS